MDTSRIEEFTDSHLDDLHRLYRNEWWTEGRARDDLPRLLDRSDEVIAFAESTTDELVAFACVLTDYTYKAFVFDVIVAESRRGEGLGTKLMEAIFEHHRLADVEHFELYCLEEMTHFYERMGFTEDLGTLRLMRRERSLDVQGE